MSSFAIPSRRELDVLFLDAGNTLVSMDFELIARELAALGRRVEARALSRAEAAARPLVSRAVGAGQSTEGVDLFSFYLARVLERCLPLQDPPLRELVARLVPRLRASETSQRLWSAVLPGVPESLARLRDAGLRLLVVSNSDGSAERSLEDAGLRGYFDAVIDSHLVGFEKPDPRIFTHALERAGSAPERTLHVGDLYHADVTGARAAGLHAVLLDPHDDWHDVDCAKLRDLTALASALLAGR